MAEEGREQNLVHCKMCIRNNITHGKYVTEAQPYTWCVTGHTKNTQKYNIDELSNVFIVGPVSSTIAEVLAPLQEDISAVMAMTNDRAPFFQCWAELFELFDYSNS